MFVCCSCRDLFSRNTSDRKPPSLKVLVIEPQPDNGAALKAERFQNQYINTLANKKRREGVRHDALSAPRGRGAPILQLEAVNFICVFFPY